MRIDPENLLIESWPNPKLGGMQAGMVPKGVKITHKPTGVSVEFDEHRNQHLNKAEAERMLSDKLDEVAALVDRGVRASMRILDSLKRINAQLDNP